jgi:hypothetical protein
VAVARGAVLSRLVRGGAVARGAVLRKLMSGVMVVARGAVLRKLMSGVMVVARGAELRKLVRGAVVRGPTAVRGAAVGLAGVRGLPTSELVVVDRVAGLRLVPPIDERPLLDDPPDVFRNPSGCSPGLSNSGSASERIEASRRWGEEASLAAGALRLGLRT